MKNLIKKLKKTNRFLRYLFSVTFIFYITSVILLTRGLLLLSGIETFLRYAVIVTFIIILIIYIMSSLVFLILKKNSWLVVTSVLIILLSSVNSVGYYYIDKTYSAIKSIGKNTILYTTNLVALTGNDDINNVGMINQESDIEGYVLPKEYMETKKTKYKVTEYDDYYSLLAALYNEELDAIFITANYKIVYSSSEEYTNIAEETYVVDTYSKEMENKELDESTNKSVTEPFSLLIIGVDSEHQGLKKNAAFNGDALMLITFNPKTLAATIFSIPRDTYVPVACNNNRSNKINSAAAYGSKCIINTIENLVGFEIDYNVKLNFKGMVALVDALGGIEVEVPKPDFPAEYCLEDSNRVAKNICLTAGKQVLDGEHALALARVRKAFTTGDFRRGQNQQLVVEAIARKAKSIRNINDFYKIIDAITDNLDTNMSPKEMLNFYNVGKSILSKSSLGNNDFFNIQRTQLTGYDLTLYMYGTNTYTFQYYEESLKEIVDAMLVNMEKAEPEIIKTFSFSANKVYEIPVIGKKYSSSKRNETLPSFIGQSYNYLENWNSSRNLNITRKENESNVCIDGEILEQSVHQGTLVSGITDLSVTVCKNVVSIPTTTTAPITTEPVTDSNLEDFMP